MTWKIILKRVWFSIRWYWVKNIYKRNYKEQGNIKLEKNIYHEDKDLKSFTKRQNRIHALFKYVFVVPGLLLLKKVLGKYLVHKIPDAEQFKNAQLLQETIEESLIEWYDLFLCNLDNKRIKRDITKWHFDKNPTSTPNLIRSIAAMFFTIFINDTAYLELFNIISYKYSKKILDEHGSNIKHMLYTSHSIIDVRYFSAIQQTKERVFVGELVLTEEGIKAINKYKETI